MQPIRQLFSDPEAVERAVASLRQAGVDVGDIEIVSSEPLDAYHWGQPLRPTRMGWLAALGGLLGGLGGHLLTSYAQQAYPVVTGAMPIVTRWTNLIITYELAMLGAILATLLTLLVSAGLFSRRGQPYDLEISEGKILVGLTNFPEPARQDLEQRLRDAGEGPERKDGGR